MRWQISRERQTRSGGGKQLAAVATAKSKEVTTILLLLGDHYQPLSGHFYRGIGEEDDDGEEGEGKRFGLEVKGGDPCPPTLVTTINRYQATSIGGD